MFLGTCSSLESGGVEQEGLVLASMPRTYSTGVSERLQNVFSYSAAVDRMSEFANPLKIDSKRSSDWSEMDVFSNSTSIALFAACE